MSSYEDALDLTRDLTEDARADRLRPIWFREKPIALAREYLEADRSVLLVGPPGVGKTAIIHGIASALAASDSGTALRQVSCNELLAGTRYLGEWQSKVSELTGKAAATGTILYFSDIWNLRTVGRTAQDPSGILDVIGPLVESGGLRLIGEVHPQKLREMQRDPRLLGIFQQILVLPLTDELIDDVIDREALRYERRLDAETRRTIIALSSRFLPRRGQPGPALELFSRAIDYENEKDGVGEKALLTKSFIEKVFSIYSGLPLFIVSRSETASATDIRSWFTERIVGQRQAIEAMVEMIALFKAGLQDPSKPLGTFFFVGPTGVGKTELARALAEFLFGSASRLLRFDLSEFKDYHSFEMLLGAANKPERPARLLDPVRSHPFQVVLFDELEKAHSNVWDVLLPLLDDGQLSGPGGEPVSFRSTIVIVTSNVGARGSDKSLGFGAVANRPEAISKALEQQFRPEFLNRFQHLVVFHPLSLQQVKLIATMELKKVLAREGITARNIIVDVADEALDLVISRGFDPKYGARALKRELQRQVVLPIAMTLLERQIDAGTVLRVVETKGELRVRVIDTEESREARREREPISIQIGDKATKLTREEIQQRASLAVKRCEGVATAVDESLLERERSRILELRQQPEFWSKPEHASLALRDLDRIGWIIHRLDRLRDRSSQILEGVVSADMRKTLVDLGARLEQLETDIGSAQRELVTVGPDGHWDALVEVKPLGSAGRVARDMLLKTYRDWAEFRGMRVEWIREPLDDDEPLMISVAGRCAYGYLAAERGLHRIREGESTSVAAVRVAPWTDGRAAATLVEHRALKKTGQFGGRVRSRIAVEGGLVLQNPKRLAENRDLASELAPSWGRAGDAGEEIVRRYDRSPFLVRDSRSGISTGRSEVLRGRGFHELLCRRLDAAMN